LPVDLAQERLGRNRAVRQGNALVARPTGPLVNVLKQMVVNRLEMFGVELPGTARPGLYFGIARGDQRRLEPFKFLRIVCPKLILEGYSVGKGIARHESQAKMERLEARNDLRHLDFAMDIGFKDRIGFWPARESFNPIMCITSAHALAAALHLIGADLGFWLCGRNDVHVSPL
jgi:hypothetical protein